MDTWTVYSIGGGALSEENRPPIGEISDVYDMSHLSDILRWCEHSGRSYWEYVEEREGVDIWEYLSEVWKNMKECIQRGLDTEGVLPGPLNLRRKAADYFIQAGGYKEALRDRGLLFAYALAVSEENAGTYDRDSNRLAEHVGFAGCIISFCRKNRGLAICVFSGFSYCGLIGNIVKTNASISGCRKSGVREKSGLLVQWLRVLLLSY